MTDDSASDSDASGRRPGRVARLLSLLRTPLPARLQGAPSSSRAAGRPVTRSDSESPYGSEFWLAYLANTTLMMAVSVLFRYADFVSFLGGSELQLGMIVGVGMVGALMMRVFLGVGIDRYGPRRVWLVSLALLACSLYAHVWVDRLDSVGIYALRMLYMVSLAGAFGASITYISLRSPTDRMAEMIGMLGSSGFVGLALGPIVGDLILTVPEITRDHVDRMFLFGAAMGIASFALAALATRHQVTPARRKQPPLWRVLRRYHPGTVLIVGIAMGVGIGLPHTFLRTYAAHLDIKRIQLFFLVYAIVAFVVRIGSRRLLTHWGNRRCILIGLSSLATSMLCFLLVRNEWLLAIPAIAGGFAHAFLFPSVVASGNVSFPVRYRGLATTVTLAMFDIGNLFGQPVIGAILEHSQRIRATMQPTPASGSTRSSAADPRRMTPAARSPATAGPG